MSNKFTLISELAYQTAKEISQNSKNWTSFLKTVARQYKYPFSNQLLIYAQKPEAAACATMDIWNKKLGRWINAGSKGIAIIDDTQSMPKLNYVFDVSDTHAVQGGKTPWLWEFQNENRETVINELEKLYGPSDKTDIGEKLMDLAEKAVDNNYEDFYDDLKYDLNDSFLADLDDLNLNVLFRDTVTKSVQYVLLTRCGIDTAPYFNKEDFKGIINFNSFEVLSHTGDAIKKVSNEMLTQIRTTIKHIEIEKMQNTLDKSVKKEYTKTSDKFSTLNREITGKEDVDNEKLNLYKGKRRGASELNSGKQRNSTGQVRTAQAELPKGIQERDVHENAVGGQTLSSSSGSGESRTGENGTDNKRFDEATEHNREVESRKSNRMGSADEQYQSSGGGNSSRGDNLQISFFPNLPTVEEQKQQIENNIAKAEDDFSSAFSFTLKDIQSELLSGTGIEDGKFRVYELYKSIPSKKEAVDFLKKEYGQYYGHSHTFLDGTNGFIDYQPGSGMTANRYNDNQKVTIKWEDIEKYLRDLNSKDIYLTSEEKAEYEEMQKAEVLPKIEPVKKDNAETPNVTDELPPKKPKINYHITDDHLGEGGAKVKYQRNIEAIRTIKNIENEERYATPEEQEILSQYVGWGGLPQAFDDKDNSWSKEYNELKRLLTDSEYKSARSSTLNAHYTSPLVIRSVYKTLENMDIPNGNILEPAMGTGNFFGMLPESMNKNKLYGVELDSISGRISKQLYQNADIQIRGFEKTDFPDEFFDIAVGNVPFGDYKVVDKKFDKYNFLIHDYFFAKTLDKVRTGGIVAFITTKGTLDKTNSNVRQYIAQRADLLGAIRLPNTAFKANAGTEVTADIIFLQKRDHTPSQMPEWVELGNLDNGISVNKYFASHPEMILGKMAKVSGPFGMEAVCLPNNEMPLSEQLEEAVRNIEQPNRELLQNITTKTKEEIEIETIPAEVDVRNYSYTLVNDEVYYRENSRMYKVPLSDTAAERTKGLIKLRDCTRALISMQMFDSSNDEIKAQQKELSTLYDSYTKKYGLINSRANKRVFEQDSGYYLLCSLEVLDEDGNLERKADMFSKRTIKQAQAVLSVDTASEALAVSISEKACVDLEYMAQLMGGPDKIPQIIKDLEGVIFLNPKPDSRLVSEQTPKWEAADEYLSGNVREKLYFAQRAAKQDPKYSINVQALQKVQPKELEASEIDVRLGATWVELKYYKQFMTELFNTPKYLLVKDIDLQYSPVSGVWNIKGKLCDSKDNVLVNVTYGTKRLNAYKILEDSLNLKEVKVFDIQTDDDGKEHRILNGKETAIAQQKQELIRQAFRDWIWKDPKRREVLVKKYNEIFNSTRPREYDGNHIRFVGINPEITLRPHQLNAVAHILYGQNTLLAHCVGAGKTYEMTAAAMESKRLGLCQKSLFVVPNHLTEQWGSDFLQLYPGANILVATKKDFTPQNRKKFCARIATGDYDAIIIGHSQFEKIPVSKERQIQMIEEQINEIATEIEMAIDEKGENFTVKQMEKTKKGLMARLEKLNDINQDDVVTFEELGVDRLFVDEADSFKNLFLYTKMRNVAGIGHSEAQKSSDMFMKCRYMDEITGSRGVVFATGTPISNSMTELYTMMRYLQYDTLQNLGLGYFDSWASSFGETVTATELAPEGTGFRQKTRFAKFYNLPELMNIWREAADIQTADMLKLPVPEVEYVDMVTKPSEHQKEAVKGLAERADKVRSNQVEPHEDNMLKITSDGKKLALDQRLMNPLLPDEPNSKINTCVKNVFDIWQNTAEQKSTQLLFCDLSTPHYDGNFNVYDDIKDKLIQKGVPSEEVVFIHDAKTEIQKSELFAKVRKGQVRVLIGSTSKMGAGTNVQDRIVALHHLDCPWKPRDLG